MAETKTDPKAALLAVENEISALRRAVGGKPDESELRARLNHVEDALRFQWAHVLAEAQVNEFEARDRVNALEAFVAELAEEA